MRRSVLGLQALLLASCAVLLAGPAYAQEQPPAAESADTHNLLDLPLEQLMDLEVTSVSKKPQPLSSAAAAIYVINREDIRRSGASTIPELLRMVPGVDVAQADSRHWAVSVRGFNGIYSAKLLVLVDGRSVYSAVFSGVLWDQVDVPLRDIERIEVIRGPGGTIWGANAVNGVINIITRKAGDTQGPSLTVGTGSDVHAEGTLQYGGKVGESVSYRLYAKGFDRPGFVTAGGDDFGDKWRGGSFGGRLDWTASPQDELSLDGQFYRQRMENPSVLPSLTGPPVDTLLIQHNTGGHVMAQWDHQFSAGSQLALQAFYDRVDYQDSAGGVATDTWDIDLRHHLQAGSRHDIVWGGGYRRIFHEALVNPYLTMTRPKGGEVIFNGFVQDEFAITPTLHLIGGVKLEHNTFTGWENEPSLRLAWRPTPDHTIWASVSRAIRMPSLSEEYMHLFIAGLPGSPAAPPIAIVLQGNPGLQKSEELLAWEAGYRGVLSPSLTVDLAAFYNRYSRLAFQNPTDPFFALDPPPPHLVIPIRYDNLLKGRTYGAELSVNWRPTSWWRLSGSVSLLQYRFTSADPAVDPALAAATAGVGPHYQAQIRSYIDLPGRTEFDAAVYRVGAQAPTALPAYTRLDLRLGWRASDRVSVSLAGRNLLQSRHPEFSPILFAQQPTEVPRSVYLSLRVGY